MLNCNTQSCTLMRTRNLTYSGALVPSSSISPLSLPLLSLSSLHGGQMGGDAPAECIFPAAGFMVTEKKKQKRAAGLPLLRTSPVAFSQPQADLSFPGVPTSWIFFSFYMDRGDLAERRVQSACITDLDLNLSEWSWNDPNCPGRCAHLIRFLASGLPRMQLVALVPDLVSYRLNLSR